MSNINIEGIWARITPELFIGVKSNNGLKINDELIQYEIEKIEVVYFMPDSTLCCKFMLESSNNEVLRIVDNTSCDYYCNQTEIILLNPFFCIEKIYLHKNTILQITGDQTKFYLRLPPENIDLLDFLKTNIHSDLS